jgi:glutamate synthase (ferredoxin)
MPEDISRYYTDLLDDDLVTRIGSPTIFDQYIPVLGTRSTVSLHVSQWRNQHLRGNISRMRAREELMKVMFWRRHQKNFPIILEGKSDSASMIW